MNENSSTPTKEQIVKLLDAWIHQRPDLEYANYGDSSSYRSELRGIARDLHAARELLRTVEMSSITTPEAAILDWAQGIRQDELEAEAPQ